MNINIICSHYLLRIATMVLTATLSLSAVHAAESALKPVGGMLSPQMHARYDTLTAKAQVEGTVRVIVRLKHAPPVTPASGTMGVRMYQRSIASTQSRIATRLANRTAVTTYKSLPYMAMEVDALELMALRQSPEIEAVFEDRLLSPALAETVPLIGARRAAAAGYSGAGQTIAILDTGVDKTHPDLAGKVVHEACFSRSSPIGNTSGVCPNGKPEMIGESAAVPCRTSGCEHGTHVAAIAAGRKGVARGANIIAVQVFGQVNSKQECAPHPAPCTLGWDSDSLTALDHIYSLRHRFNIAAVNMSSAIVGHPFTGACDGNPNKPFIDTLHAAGIATVVAAGNEGYTNAINVPACVSNAVSVGATDNQDLVASFTNCSPALDLLAPGVGVVSAVPGGGYASYNGTSQAAPHVAGAFAVLKGAAPSAGVDTLLEALRTTGVPVTNPSSGILKPRIRIDQALNALLKGPG